MLLNNFCFLNQISAQSADDKTRIEANLTINRSHSIFNGHFPGLPIVPGVCMVQIIKEILEEQLNRKLSLRQAGNIKFLAMINPEINSEVNADIRYSTQNDTVDVEGQLHFGPVIFFKIKAEFGDRLK